MIYDIFHFINELDCLEIRLNELNSIVDYFVIIETNKNIYSLEDEKSVFQENKELFSDFKDKIIYKQIDLNNYINFDNYLQRYYQIFDDIIYEIDFNPDDLLILSEVYEIPSSDAIKKCLNIEKICQIELTRFISYYNNLNELKWYSPKVLKQKYYDGYSNLFGYFQEINSEMELIENGGWFFENVFEIEKFNKYLKQYIHLDYWKDWKDKNINEYIKNKKQNRLDFYGNKLNPIPISIEFYPEYFVENQYKFQSFILNGIIPGNHFFSTLDYNQKQIYEKICQKCQNNSKFLKIGDYTGEATKYLTELIDISDKNIKLYLFEDFKRQNNLSNNYIYELENKRYGLKIEDIFHSYCFNSNITRIDSIDGYFDFIFIDYEKDIDYINAMINTCRNKLAPNGVIAGILPQNCSKLPQNDAITIGNVFYIGNLGQLSPPDRNCIGFEVRNGIGDVMIAFSIINQIQKIYSDSHFVIFYDCDYKIDIFDIFDLNYNKIVKFEKNNDNIYKKYEKYCSFFNYIPQKLWNFWDIISFNINQPIKSLECKLDKIDLRQIYGSNWSKINTVQPYTSNKLNIVNMDFYIDLFRKRFESLFKSNKNELFILLGAKEDLAIGNFKINNVANMIGQTTFKESCQYILSSDHHYAIESWSQIFCAINELSNTQYWDFESFPVYKNMINGV